MEFEHGQGFWSQSYRECFKSWLVQTLKQALSFLISNTVATFTHAGLRPEGGALCVNILNASRFAIAGLCS
jgi:hypothetical protein